MLACDGNCPRCGCDIVVEGLTKFWIVPEVFAVLSLIVIGPFSIWLAVLITILIWVLSAHIAWQEVVKIRLASKDAAIGSAGG